MYKRQAYIDYAMSVIVSRALPDVRDGLKPVHRRILYAMHEDGITSDKPYRKCANTVGSVLGRYHPHGDASVYDAMVRMAQDFSMRYMLIDGHGNFGSIDGDGAAAMRYTEARMSKIAESMLTDIEIAQQTKLRPIKDVAKDIGITEDELEFYGKYKAKLSEELFKKLESKPDGKLILVTAINPTPAGEGKTTVTTGLGQAMNKLGKKTVIALREPSLGPVFGIKGGAAGGGYSQVLPMEDINLHFTGDMHAITATNNLLCAMLDNHIQQGNELGIDVKRILIKRCLDMNDRELRNIVAGLGGKINGVPVSYTHLTLPTNSRV